MDSTGKWAERDTKRNRSNSRRVHPESTNNSNNPNQNTGSFEGNLIDVKTNDDSNGQPETLVVNASHSGQSHGVDNEAFLGEKAIVRTEEKGNENNDKCLPTDEGDETISPQHFAPNDVKPTSKKQFQNETDSPISTRGEAEGEETTSFNGENSNRETRSDSVDTLKVPPSKLSRRPSQESFKDILLEEMGLKTGTKEKFEKDQSSTKRLCVHWVVAIIVFLLDLADCVTDWLFYVDVELAEPGLVYGPPSDIVRWLLLAFSILGTALFILETTNLYYETVKGLDCLDSDVLSAVVIWFEDIPQVCISLYLALCREEAISVFQLTKAGIVLFSIAVRVVQLAVKYFRPAGRKLLRQHHLKTRIAIFVGVLLEALCSCAVFFLTQTALNDAGTGVAFQVPTTLIQETFNDRRYFANVSVFVNHAEYFHFDSSIDLRTPEEMSNTNKENQFSSPVLNWIRLVSVDRIIAAGAGARIQFSMQYERNFSADVFKLVMWEKLSRETGNPQWANNGCYVVNYTNGTVTEIKNYTKCDTSSGFFTSDSKNAFVTFDYIPPSTFFRRRIFGDVIFNMKVNRSTTAGQGSKECIAGANYTNSMGYVSSSIPLRFHYFRSGSHLPRQGLKFFLHSDTNSIQKNKVDNGDETVRFYRNNGHDLVYIENVWKTGWLKCDSTGSLSPDLDEHLDVDCSRQ